MRFQVYVQMFEQRLRLVAACYLMNHHAVAGSSDMTRLYVNDLENSMSPEIFPWSRLGRLWNVELCKEYQELGICEI